MAILETLQKTVQGMPGAEQLEATLGPVLQQLKPMQPKEMSPETKVRPLMDNLASRKARFKNEAAKAEKLTEQAREAREKAEATQDEIQELSHDLAEVQQQIALQFTEGDAPGSPRGEANQGQKRQAAGFPERGSWEEQDTVMGDAGLMDEYGRETGQY